MKTIEAIVESQMWTEDEVGRAGPARLVAASATRSLSGAITGQVRGHYVLLYGPGDGGRVVGYETVRTREPGGAGSFALAVEGEVRGGVLLARWRVVNGTGVGAWAGVYGEGGYEVAGDGVRFRLHYGHTTSATQPETDVEPVAPGGGTP